MLSEVSQYERDRYTTISHIWNINNYNKGITNVQRQKSLGTDIQKSIFMGRRQRVNGMENSPETM